MPVTCPSCGTDNPDSARFCAECASPLAGAEPTRPSVTRRTVTILFADVSGSTTLGEQLDPESMRALMTRYFAEMQAIIERHGGTVEKFIGDAVMAVFGMPQLHEDDALRAVRAASDIAERLRSLNVELEAQRGIAIRFRTGVNTGPVVAGTPESGATFVTGDTVNTAARLEQAAAPDAILIGPLTYTLVRDAVDVEPLPPLELKGKAERLPAFRLLSVRSNASGHARRADSILVGREAELAALYSAFEDVVTERRCGLVLVIGAAGVGKSRLLAEFSAGLAERARWLTGRCLPYGEAITYWPLAEVVRSAATVDDTDDREAALVKVRNLAAWAAEAESVGERVAQAIGLAGGSAPAEEIFWAIRKLFEGLARSQPLVIEFDDVQWADDAFLDLLEHVLTLSRDVPLLLVCPARPELLERRPGWGGGSPHASLLRLEPLAADSAAALIAQLPGGEAVPPSLRARILDAAEGNPLYVEELLGMLVDEGQLTNVDGHWQASGDLAAVRLPPTIAAILSARLDQLPAGERSLAERASVVGQVFEQVAVAELLPAARRSGLMADLLGLVRKELIRPEHEQLVSSGDVYRFRHLLIRDAAYEALTKAERAELHARFANWFERVSGDRIEEVEEIVGYHLEQAYRYEVELGSVGPATADLADRAASRLAAAGRRAMFRSGAATAINLLERALALRPEPSAQRAELLVRLASPKSMTGQIAEARGHAAEALAWATEAGDEVSRAMAEVATVRVAAAFEAASMPDMQRAAVTLANAGRHRDACYAYYVIMEIRVQTGRYAEAVPYAQAVIEQARLSGDAELLGGARAHQAKVWAFGPTPVQPLLQDLESQLTALAGSKDAERALQFCLAELYGLIGRFEEAREAALASRTIDLEIGSPVDAASASQVSGPLERLAGNAKVAEDTLRTDLKTLSDADERWLWPTTAGMLAHVLCDRGAFDEAISIVDDAERIASPEDYLSIVHLLSARARALAGRDPAAALSLAQEAVAAAAETDDLVRHGMVLLSLADVHEAAGRSDRARDAIQRARDLFGAKGATAYVELADRRITGLATSQL